jgi:hypothetical protein
MKQFLFVIALILTIPMLSLAQQKDSLIVKDTTGKIIASSKVKHGLWRDSTGHRTFNPRKAALYSAVFPGLGQIYNKKYWKVPIVYAAVGTSIYSFFYNKQWYNRFRYALTVADMDHTSQEYADALLSVHPRLVTFVEGQKTNVLLNNRNEYRKSMDYSILFTLLFWGLNVVDATVDAHLKGFNVNDNLSMQVKPAILSNQAIGVSIVFKFTDNRPKAIP